MTAEEFLIFKLETLCEIRDAIDSGSILVSTVKARQLLDAFDYVEQLHRSSEM